jgi:hypothetical protein
MKRSKKRLTKAKITDGFVRRGDTVRSTSSGYLLAGKVDDITFEWSGGTRIWVSWGGMEPSPMGGRELKLQVGK